MNEQQRAVWEKVVELLEDNREYIEANERPEYLALYDKGIADANALLMQPVQEPVASVYYDAFLAKLREKNGGKV